MKIIIYSSKNYKIIHLKVYVNIKNKNYVHYNIIYENTYI